MFAADQHISEWFQAQAKTLANLDLRMVPAASNFAARHEKFVIIDDTVAWLGGMDLSHNRWDTTDHRGDDPSRVNPDGEEYVPYHDTQFMFRGPAVRELFLLALGDGVVPNDWDPPDAPAEQPQFAWDARDREIYFSVTRSHPVRNSENVQQIIRLYRDLIAAAEDRIYIENQYFSSDEITRTLISRLEEPDGPEVIIIVPQELPDTLGRVTMGANTALHLSDLIEHDHHHRLGIFHLVSPDDEGVGVKVHSKTMIVDGTAVTVGSANISRRSFSLDSEMNVTIVDAEPGGVSAVAALEDRLISQHLGVSPEEWRDLLSRHDGSWLPTIRDRIQHGKGVVDGRDNVLEKTPQGVPRELLDRLDMDEPPPQETVVQRIVRSNPWAIISRTRRIWMSSLVAIALIGAFLYLGRSNLDIRDVLRAIEEINTGRPALGVLLTILTFWLTMAFFITIVVPIVFFAALHGPFLGILYSTIGVFSGAAIFYGIGLALHTAPWLDDFRAVRRAKEQLEGIKRYGLWAVAMSRMVPSGPFMVVNLVTGLLGFSPSHFLAGSAIGLLPGIVAFSIFGEVIRNVFTDPSWTSVTLFGAFILAYFGLVRGLLALFRRIAAWATGEPEERWSGS
jgi:phosphatidylserine/phosphatidylglycerophosphate/cardiolipin synthase-like enzyme/membrane protein DedA with SNARE-associated domain